jgi:hypothetical protein
VGCCRFGARTIDDIGKGDIIAPVDDIADRGATIMALRGDA